MYEYKVETYRVKEAETKMNKLASEGWRVIAVSPNIGMGHGIVVTYERQKNWQSLLLSGFNKSKFKCLLIKKESKSLKFIALEILRK